MGPAHFVNANNGPGSFRQKGPKTGFLGKARPMADYQSNPCIAEVHEGVVDLDSSERRDEAGSNRAMLGQQPIEYWTAVAKGVLLAGSVYPTVSFLGYVGIGAVVNRVTLNEFFEIAVVMAVMALPAAIVAFCWAAIAGFITLPIVHLAVRSLHIRGDLVMLGAFSGGTVGFVAVLLLMLPTGLLEETGNPMLILVWLSFGPGLTTVLGQIGGAWGARRGIQKHKTQQRLWALRAEPARAVLEADAETRFVSVHAEANRVPQEADKIEPQFQFGMGAMMWAFFWVSLLLTLMRLCGVPMALTVPLLAGWLVYQAATLWAGRKIALRLAPWWRNRWGVPRGTIVRVPAGCAFHVEHTNRELGPEPLAREVVSRETR